jgi:hypothetical protein
MCSAAASSSQHCLPWLTSQTIAPAAAAAGATGYIDMRHDMVFAHSGMLATHHRHRELAEVPYQRRRRASAMFPSSGLLLFSNKACNSTPPELLQWSRQHTEADQQTCRASASAMTSSAVRYSLSASAGRCCSSASMARVPASCKHSERHGHKQHDVCQ